MKSLDGKVAIVTGGARGIGRSVALHLAGLGAAVLVADKSFQAAREFGEELAAENTAAEIEMAGGQAVTHEGDLVKLDVARDMVAACLRRFGRVDILVNCVGGMITPFERSQASKIPEADVRLIFDINYMAMMNACQAAAIPLRTQGSGSIVNMSSVAARSALADGLNSIYGAMKAAVTHYSRSLAMELAPSGVRVNSVAPGVIQTSRIVAMAATRNVARPDQVKSVPLGRYGEPVEVAKVVEFLVTDLSSYVTGQSISVCGGRHMSPT